MASSGARPGILERPRAILGLAIALIAALSWAYLLAGAGMHSMPGMAASFAALATMWTVMMAAMMLPAATPLVLLYSRGIRHYGELARGGLLIAGYLFVWGLFGIGAAWLQHGLGPAGLDPRYFPALLAAAGLYQWSPLKDRCLGRCRAPARFLAEYFRPGSAGAFRLGLVHGLYCLGCCWLIMLLLFVGGVMNLAWVALLTLLVSAEKLLPGGPWVARIAGLGLIGWAAALLLV